MSERSSLTVIIGKKWQQVALNVAMIIYCNELSKEKCFFSYDIGKQYSLPKDDNVQEEYITKDEYNHIIHFILKVGFFQNCCLLRQSCFQVSLSSGENYLKLPVQVGPKFFCWHLISSLAKLVYSFSREGYAEN